MSRFGKIAKCLFPGGRMSAGDFFDLRRDPFERASFNSNNYCDLIVNPQLYKC